MNDLHADLLAAKERLLNAPRRPELSAIHPQMHDRACDLLGVPHGSPLTVADMWRAVEIERNQSDHDKRDDGGEGK